MNPVDTHSTAGIILIGDELLSGKVEDVNGALLIRELRALGIAVTELHVVADIHERIVEAISLVRVRNDVVFTSGGVGPTHDDRTLDAVSSAFDAPLSERAALREMIQHRFGDDPENPWLKMSRVPEGCELLFHPDTRWPVMKMQNVYVLPGIPEVFARQFEHIKSRFRGEAIHLRTVFVTPHEGVVARILNDLDATYDDVDFGSYPVLDNPRYSVRITIEGRDPASVAGALEAVLERLEDGDVVEVL